MLLGGGGCLLQEGCLIPGGAWSRDMAVPKGCLVWGVPGLGGGRCLLPGGAWSGGGGGCGDPPLPGTATAVGGMHPTGMHSCSQ